MTSTTAQEPICARQLGFCKTMPRARTRSWLTAGLLAGAQLTAAYTLDLSSTDSLKSVASSMTEDMMSFYSGDKPGGTPGLLPQPYYWWEAGALMGALIDYWYYTGDTRWNALTTEGLLFQTGPNNDYMPPNQTVTEGNDDQGFWGMAVMTAAEYNFDNPPPDKPQWLSLAQAVFNTQAARWDTKDCGGGLRWQIFTWNNGYDYKNSISQACFFNLAARLALYTGNQSYADWADKTWDWMVATNLINSEYYYVYDGTHTNNCSEITPYQWTYNAGAFLLGAAALYNYSTGPVQSIWRDRVDGLLNGTQVFFTGPNKDIMTEVACEPVDLCDLDQQSFKAYLSRWMAATTKWAPWTYDRIKPLLQTSAQAAVGTCTGGANGRMCGLKWDQGAKWDGSMGVGQQMAAMEVVLGNMIEQVDSPVTDRKGGTSKGDPGAGGLDMGRNDPLHRADAWPPVSQGGKAGAWILMLLTVVGVVGGCVFVLVDEGRGVKEQIEGVRDVVIVAGGMGRRRKGNKLRKESPDILGAMVAAGSLEKERGGGVSRSDSDRTLRGDEGSENEWKTEAEHVVKPVGEPPIIQVPHPRNRKPLRTTLLAKQHQRQSSKATRGSYWKENDGSGETVVDEAAEVKNVDNNNNVVETASTPPPKKRRDSDPGSGGSKDKVTLPPRKGPLKKEVRWRDTVEGGQRLDV
ncbi:family 76 putative glycoside hydrolase [Cercophora samala]|uniref:mannan endo-1,6-alpha-mannosidase n=1 Tax=Cercophora samala TaxID=330535 RepID=A0AA39ZCV9_9PEZI|nr:family 76 putative glycoside hydrolase [Cercophora samala]